MFDPNNPCIFCHREPHQVIAETELAILSTDDYPVSRGHCLIIPKRHFATLFDATEAEIIDFHRLMVMAKSLVDTKQQPDGYNVGSNNGVMAGQSVFHLHIHIIPRYQGDVANPKGGVRWVIPQKAGYSLADKKQK